MAIDYVYGVIYRGLSVENQIPEQLLNSFGVRHRGPKNKIYNNIHVSYHDAAKLVFDEFVPI